MSLLPGNDPKTLADLWVLPLGADRKAFPFLRTNAEESNGQFSPDGRWVAYESNPSGSFEIYVRPFLGQGGPRGEAAAPSTSGGQWQVSTSGGTSPRWRPDGKELYFVAPNGMLMATPIAVNGGTLEPGTPVALFQPRMAPGGVRPQYDVAPDGRLLINVLIDDPTPFPITLILNWKPIR